MAANPEKGEVNLVINGKTYTLTLKTAGLIAFQKRFSQPGKVADLGDLFQRVADGSIEHAVAFIWAALQKFHPEVTYEATQELVDDAGGVFAIGQQLQELQGSTVPDPADIEEIAPTNGAKNPRGARIGKTRGTGGRGTSRHAASV